MKIVNIHEAKTHFSKLIESVRQGNEVVIATAGKPVAKLIGISPQTKRFGVLKGKISISKDFDNSLPDEMIQSFEE